MITYSETKDFSAPELERLFLSVKWYSGRFPEKLVEAMRNSTCVISAWDAGRLVGLLRALDDGVWQATIDCLLVDSEYQGRGIAGELMARLKERYRDLLYISVAPEDKKACKFYERHGFHIVENGATMQLQNPWE